MKRNTIRRYYDKFFGEKVVQDMDSPIRCVKTTEAKQLSELASKYLGANDFNNFKRAMRRLEIAVYKEMRKKDEALLRDIEGRATIGDEQRKAREQRYEKTRELTNVHADEELFNKVKNVVNKIDNTHWRGFGIMYDEVVF